jgi:hypothetical protein
MIAPPPGWSVRRCEESLLLVPPGGPAAGAIRYVERLRPLRRAVELVRAAPAPAGFVETRLSPPERLVTAEGEHAALVISEGTIGAVPVERPFGFVFGDDFYARFAGVAVGGENFARIRAMVRALTIADTHDLGVRRRRYVYAPPRDWHGLARLFEATWYPRDYPATRASITVCPAVPAQPGLAGALLHAVLATGRSPIAAPVGVVAREGLDGQLWRLRGDGVETDVALLEDARYVYALRLDAALGAGAARARFAEVVASVEPVPAIARRSAAAVGMTLSHWSE